MKPITRTREEVYNLWIAALRSGKYKQTKAALRDSKGFCCLGVLCDLAAKDGGDQWNSYESYKKSFSKLPSVMRNYLLIEKFEQDLIEMNDSGNSFKVIAKHIEEVVMPEVLGKCNT